MARRLLNQTLYEKQSIEPLIGRYGPEEVRRAIALADSKAAPGDMVVIYFAGHGLREVDDHGSSQLWLCAALRTGAGAGLAGVAVALDQTFDELSDSSASAILVILDCCFAGQVDGRSVLGPNAIRMLAVGRPFPRFVPPELAGEGRAVMSASLKTQEANESSSLRHGIFTHALLARLAHGRGRGVALATAFADVRNTVLRLSGGRQCPTLFGGDAGLELPHLPERTEARRE